MNVFPIAPAESRYLWFLIPVIVILLGVMALLATSLRGAHASRFEIRADGLRLEGDLYGRLLPRSALRGDRAGHAGRGCSSPPRSTRRARFTPSFVLGPCAPSGSRCSSELARQRPP